jgi:hypothetical protein
MNTATLKTKHRSVQIIKFEEDVYFILQLYFVAKTSEKKRVPMLPVDDSRKNIVSISATAKHVGFKKSFLQQLHIMTAPVFKRTAA